MNFFNKYKDLFGVPDVHMLQSQGTPFPQSKLSLNNHLFIEKPYQPSYQQSYNLNTKLQQLKKDYDSFEQEISQIKVPTPRKQSAKKDSPLLKSSKKKEKPMLVEKKRRDWLHDQQNNLFKHSELDYIFNEQMQKQYPRFDRISESTIPKMSKLISGEVRQYEPFKLKSKPRNQNLRMKKRQRMQEKSPIVFSKGRHESTNTDLARARREEAKKNLSSRRQKLGLLLRTSW